MKKIICAMDATVPEGGKCHFCCARCDDEKCGCRCSVCKDTYYIKLVLEFGCVFDESINRKGIDLQIFENPRDHLIKGENA